MPKPMTEARAKAYRNLLGAAKRVLDILHDDHEDCTFCLVSEKQAHEPGSACYELEVAVKAVIRA